MNRRTAEAISLRAFFESRWGYLKNLLDEWQVERLQQRQEREVLNDAVETIVDWTDARIRAVSSYREELRESTRALLDHIENIVASIPAASTIDRHAYLMDPLVHLVFEGPEEIKEVINRDPKVRDMFNVPSHWDRRELFALLFANRKEKHILGTKLQGEMLLREVRQTVVSFSGHRLLAPRGSERQARSALKRILFDSVVEYLEGLNLQMRYAQTGEGRGEDINRLYQTVKNPEVYLEILKEQLSLPQKLIRLRDSVLSVNSMGIKLRSEYADSPEPVRLHELTVGEARTTVLCLVKIPRSEWP